MFKLTKDQSDKIAKWKNDKLNDKAYTGAVGGRFTYSFTPNNLGLVVKVTDGITNDVLDVSDYDW